MNILTSDTKQMPCRAEK